MINELILIELKEAIDSEGEQPFIFRMGMATGTYTKYNEITDPDLVRIIASFYTPVFTIAEIRVMAEKLYLKWSNVYEEEKVQIESISYYFMITAKQELPKSQVEEIYLIATKNRDAYMKAKEDNK